MEKLTHVEIARKKAEAAKAKEKAVAKERMIQAQEEPPIPPPPKLECYFSVLTNQYFVPNSAGDWIPHKEAQFSRFLRGNGFREKVLEPGGLDQVETKMLKTMHHFGVEYAGPLAGYKPGHYDFGTMKALVTKGPKLFEPKKGEFKVIKNLLDQLFGEQVFRFWGWMKFSLESLYKGPPWRPGQMLAIAGPAGSGKSFLQGIITEMLGGRTANPYKYMTGKTDFNGDLLGAEHLAISDEPAGKDAKSRDFFGAQLKALSCNEYQSGRTKFKEAMTLKPFWRISLALNERPEDLQVIPPLTESIRDKIILLRASKVNFPFSDAIPGSREKYRESISAELPHFIYHLLKWKLPKEYSDQRFGIVGFIDPLLEDEVNDLEKEFLLLDAIDRLLPWERDREEFIGTPSDLERELAKLDESGQVTRLAKNDIQLGIWISKLHCRFPSRFQRIRGKDNRRGWKIKLLPKKEEVPPTPEKFR